MNAKHKNRRASRHVSTKAASAYVEPLHPKRGDALTDLDRTLLRLRLVALEMQELLRGAQHPVVPESGSDHLSVSLAFATSNYALILVAKFLEVTRTMGTAKELPRMIEVLDALSPALARINMWPGIKDHRDSALAHAFLTRDGKFIHPVHQLAGSAAPTQHAECFALLQLSLVAIGSILQAFVSEWDDVKTLTRSDLPVPAPLRGVIAGHQIRDDLAPIADECDEALRAVGVDVTNGSVFKEFELQMNSPHRPA